MTTPTGHLVVVSLLISLATIHARTILQDSFSDAFGSNGGSGGSGPFGNSPPGFFPPGGVLGNSANPFSASSGFPGNGANVQESDATTPVSSTGAPWDFVVTGELSIDPDTAFADIGSSPQNLLQEAFGSRAFRVNDFGDSFQVLLNSGQDITFALRERSQVGRFLIFEITGHSLEIFVIEDINVNIRGTEISFQVTGEENAVVEIGARTEVQPGEVREEVNEFLEGFLELLVTSFRMRFGGGQCDDDDNEAEGVCNNPNGQFGTADVPLLRLAQNDPAFADGVSAPSGPTEISARLISNICGDQGTDEDDATNRLGLTDSFVTFGQFIDHDISLSAESTQAEDEQPLFSLGNALNVEDLPIPVPEDDPVFTGPNRRETLEFTRAPAVRENGVEVSPRQFSSSLTSLLDLTQVYADEPIRRRALRSFEGGKLKTGADNFLPKNGAGPDGVGVSLENAPNADPRLYVAGDIRVGENAELTSVHVVWLREHNRVADEIAAVMNVENDGDDDEEENQTPDETLFRLARSVTIATYQSILYSEWLPRLLGEQAPNPDDASFNPNVDPTLTALFAAAVYRFGHSMVNNVYTRRDAGATQTTSTVALNEIFINPDAITSDNIADILRGSTNHEARERDMQVVSPIRNLLFSPDGAPSMDLYSLNIQRGRDFGLPSYNVAREAMGLPSQTSFDQITADPEEQDKLSRAYGSVDLVEPFIGGLAEDAPADRLHGDFFQTVLLDQFTRIRDGDRLFYKNFPFSDELRSNYPRIDDIVDDEIKWGDIIARNTDATTADLQQDRDSVFQL